MTEQEIAGIYETLLSMPGMEDPVKLDLKVSRKLVLLLTHALEDWEQKQDPEPVLLRFIPGSRESLKQIIQECLSKSGLTDLNQKLKQLR